MIPPAVRLADAAARGPSDGHAPEPGSQPVFRPQGPRTPLGRAGEGALDTLLDLALAAVPGRARPRRVPSAGALYPVDAHIFHLGRHDLYDPIGHALVLQAGGPVSDGTLVVLSLAPERTRWKYGSRSLPSLLLDLGHAVGALAAAAAALGLDCLVQLDADAGSLAALTGRPHSLAALFFGEPGQAPSAWPERQRPAPEGGDLVTDALIALGRGTREPTWHHPGLPPVTAGTLRARRSADPPFTGRLTRAELDSLLAGTPLLAATAEGLRTAGGAVATGDARPTLAAWAAGQGFLADAAAVLLCTASLRDYRLEHVNAGLAVHGALLTAEAMGLPARAIGSWGRADLGAALGEPPGTRMIVHGAVIGPRTKEAHP